MLYSDLSSSSPGRNQDHPVPNIEPECVCIAWMVEQRQNGVEGTPDTADVHLVNFDFSLAIRVYLVCVVPGQYSLKY